jgi:P27 family predicted phage terminase small subunit
MRGGHNIKTADEHKKTGTFQPVRHKNRMESHIEPTEIPAKPPEYFDKRHREKWLEVRGHIVRIGTYDIADMDLIEMYVCAWFVYKAALIETMNPPSETEKEKRIFKTPTVAMNDAWKIVSSISDRFGFNPRARMGIKIAPKDEHKNQVSILSLVKGGSKKVI